MKRPITQRPEAGHWKRIIRPSAMVIDAVEKVPAPAGVAEARRADDLEEAADHEEQRHHEGQHFRRDRGPQHEDEAEDAVEDRRHRMLEEAGPMADPDGRDDFDRRREQKQPAEHQHRRHGRRHRSRDGGGADDHERDAEGEEPAPLLQRGPW